MNPKLWFAYALRDLRSGLQGFWIFLACLMLGTASIAIVGSLAASIARGLAEQGQPLLGGDVEFALIHREADAKQLAFIERQGEVSRAATMRAMAVAGSGAVLVEVKAADARYPLYGEVKLDRGGPLAAALELRDGVHGIAADPLLLGRLGIETGDRVRIGALDAQVRDTIANEPDRLSDGFVFGPRVLMSEAALEQAGLVQPGSLVTYRYRVKLPGAAGLEDARRVAAQAREEFPDAGWRVRAQDRAAQGAGDFVGRLSFFMTLAGLTALIAGGAGIANAVQAFVARKMPSIATLKCVGAPEGAIFAIYLTEILLVALIGIAAGLSLGAVAPYAAHSLLSGILPLPLTARVEPVPLLLAAAYGLLVTLAFSIWPLSKTRRVAASALFRHRFAPVTGLPRPADMAAIALALLGLGVLAFYSFDDRRLTAYYLLGLAAAFVLLLGLARLIAFAAERLPRPRSAVLKHAIANLHRPGSAAAPVTLALGLGLTLFVSLALTDGTINAELRSSIPERAPAFFFLDVRNEDREAFIAQLKATPGITEVDTAPMLRGRIVKVKDIAAAEAPADPDIAWALRGDRGLTYAEASPQGSRIVEGAWWPKDYAGEPLVSFVEDVGRGLGLKIGDPVTVNVLGREVTARVANFRTVDWRSFDINFVMVFSPNTLKAAPHHHIVTVEMPGGDEAALLNATARAWPAVTAIRVKDAIGQVSELLGQIIAAVRGANVLTLITGVLVLAGALTASLSGRIYDTIVLKTYGATRAQLTQAFIAEYAILGLAAALLGVVLGSAASWFLAFWVLEMPWRFSLTTALVTALGAMAIAILSGLAVTWRALEAKPAPLLRDA